MKYTVHIVRKSEDKWERKALEWTPWDPKRKVGRPKKRWENEIRQYCGVGWERNARVRGHWKRVGEAYALKWAENW